MRLLTAQAGCGAAPVPPPAESRARLTDHAPTAAAAHASQPRPPNIFLMAEENRHESLRGTGASSSRAAHLNSQGTPACRAAAPEGGGEPADLTRPADLAGPRRVVAGPRLRASQPPRVRRAWGACLAMAQHSTSWRCAAGRPGLIPELAQTLNATVVQLRRRRRQPRTAAFWLSRSWRSCRSSKQVTIPPAAHPGPGYRGHRAHRRWAARGRSR